MFLVMYQLPKIHNFLSPSASMGTSNSLISPTLFRCCVSTFFVQNLRGISQGLALEFNTWNTPTEMTLQCRTWRSPDHLRTESMDNGSGSNGGRRGGGENGPVEAGELFDGDL